MAWRGARERRLLFLRLQARGLVGAPLQCLGRWVRATPHDFTRYVTTSCACCVAGRPRGAQPCAEEEALVSRGGLQQQRALADVLPVTMSRGVPHDNLQLLFLLRVWLLFVHGTRTW